MEIPTWLGILAGGVIIACLAGAIIWVMVTAARSRKAIRALNSTVAELKHRDDRRAAAQTVASTEPPQPRESPEQPPQPDPELTPEERRARWRVITGGTIIGFCSGCGAWAWRQLHGHPAAALTLAAATATTLALTADTAPYYSPQPERPSAADTLSPSPATESTPDEAQEGDPEDEPAADTAVAEQTGGAAPGEGAEEDSRPRGRGPPDSRPATPADPGGRPTDPPPLGGTPADPGVTPDIQDGEQPGRGPQGGLPQQRPDDRPLVCAEVRLDPVTGAEVCV